MTTHETQQLLAMVATGFPYFRSDDDAATVKWWQLVLADDDYKLIAAALVEFARKDTSGYPPTPGQLRKIAADLIGQTGELTADRAAELVAKALRRAGDPQAYEALPEKVKDVIGGADTLARWGRLNNNDLHFALLQFKKDYKAAAANGKSTPLLIGNGGTL